MYNIKGERVKRKDELWLVWHKSEEYVIKTNANQWQINLSAKMAMHNFERFKNVLQNIDCSFELTDAKPEDCGTNIIQL